MHFLQNAPCQNCGHLGLQLFYEISGVPIHSTILLESAQTALDYPTGDIKLGFCQFCGFIGNLAFDPTRHEYSTQCEESQGFSPRFNAFLRTLTLDLIDRYDIRGKTVTEIGCGKGDFLELICELGNNRGVGIDPSYVRNRAEHADSRERTEYVQTLFSENVAELTSDLVCCQHTLEHISSVQSFMKLVRRSIGDRHDTVVFFEVPDVERLLEERAFWNIYYEHCSYFTLDSLSLLFEACNFEVLEGRKDFGDQYLVVVARPLDKSNGATVFSREGNRPNVDALSSAVMDF